MFKRKAQAAQDALEEGEVSEDERENAEDPGGVRHCEGQMIFKRNQNCTAYTKKNKLFSVMYGRKVSLGLEWRNARMTQDFQAHQAALAHPRSQTPRPAQYEATSMGWMAA